MTARWTSPAPRDDATARTLAYAAFEPYLLGVTPMTSDVLRASRGIRATSARIRTHSRDLRTEWTRWHRTFLALLAMPREHRWLVMCAYCGRIRDGGSVWFELPQSIVERLHQPNNLLQVSHGACPDCLAVAEIQPALNPPRGPAVLNHLP